MSGRTNGGERAGVVVAVPTTAGLIEVMGLRWSQKIPSSRVVLGNETADQCERWTKEYNSLLRPGDPMRTLLGLNESGGYRLVVSAEIDHGRSWMMPVSAAHAAAARGQPLHNDVTRARLLVWTTGAIDFAQPETAREAKVVENDYHLIGKIDHSRALFAAAAHAGTPVLCLLPEGPDAAKAAAILGKVLGAQPHHVAIAASLADLLAPLEGFLKSGNFDALPENAQPLALYVAPAKREDQTPSDDEPRPPKPGSASAPGPGPQSTFSARTEPPPPPSPAMPKAAEPRLPLGALIGVGVLALAIGGTYLALTGLGRGGPPQNGQAGPVQQATSPIQTQPTQPTATQPTATQPTTTQPTTTQPTTTQPTTTPASTTPTLTQPRQTQPAQTQPAQTQPTQTQPAQTQPATQTASSQPQVQTQPAQPATTETPPASAAVVVARLTLLAAPQGSSCQAQIYQLPPRFAETVVEIAADRPSVEIDGANLCGLAVTGATFQRGSGSPTVASLSSPNRIVFTQSGQPIAPPALSVAGGGRVELKLK
jgi:hypothetical protein